MARAVVRFHREQQGRGPADVRAHIVGDVLLVRNSEEMAAFRVALVRP